MNESLIDLMLERFRVDLPINLDRVWTEYAVPDGIRGFAIPKPYPEVYLPGLHMALPGELPCIMIWDHDTNLLIPGQSGGGLNGYGSDEFEHLLIVFAVIESDDEEILERMLSRYKIAMWRTLKQNTVLPDAIGGSYIITPKTASRESRAASVRVLTPSTRSMVWEASVYDMENY